MASIYDVAQLAGVSPSTVSRSFRNPARISEAVRARVLAAADELDYTPKRVENALATKRTLVIGLIIADLQNPFSITLMAGMQERLSRDRHVGIVACTKDDPAQEVRVLRELCQRGVDGFIVTPPQLQANAPSNDYIRELLQADVPMVFVGNRLNDPNVHSVTSRAQDGAVQAVNYLVSLGHQDIGFIGGHYTQGIAVGRWLGYQEALLTNRLTIRPEYMVESELSRASGEAAMERLLDLPHPPTAVLAANDLMAIGAINACHKRNIHIPSQLSVIGFDNIDLAELVTPRLTTVAQPSYEMGWKAADLLLQISREPGLPPQQVLLHTSLILRESTLPPFSGTLVSALPEPEPVPRTPREPR